MLVMLVMLVLGVSQGPFLKPKMFSISIIMLSQRLRWNV